MKLMKLRRKIMSNEVDFGHLWTLFKDAHERSLDNILSHPLKAEDIEDLCEALGFPDYAFELKDDRKRQEEDDA